MENVCGTSKVGCERTQDVIARGGKQLREGVVDRAQPNDEISVRERKRARNREYNRAYRERKKMKILAGDTVHVAPDVAERRRACVRERVKRYRERKKVKQSAVTGMLTLLTVVCMFADGLLGILYFIILI
jgi:translation initiation factor IF-1